MVAPAYGVPVRSRASGELKPLSGVPLGIKDLFCTEGVQTTAGSRILEGYKPVYESTVSANLFAAGAGMLGKLNMDEFAMGSSNETSGYGPVLSPWRRNDGGNAALTPGGSSNMLWGIRTRNVLSKDSEIACREAATHSNRSSTVIRNAKAAVLELMLRSESTFQMLTPSEAIETFASSMIFELKVTSGFSR